MSPGVSFGLPVENVIFPSSYDSLTDVVSDLEAIILEKIMKTDPLYRKERERYKIRKFNSYYNGMNRSPGT